MAGSSWEGKDWLLSHYLEILPETVVDIGPGVGTYAELFREHHRAEWTGIEIHEPYVERFNLLAKYDHVVVGDAREVLIPETDLCIAGDVLEHMPKDDALRLIEDMKLAAEHLLVSVPIIEYPQGEWEGNVHETHHYHWQHDEMIEALCASASWAGEILGCYRWDR